MLSGSQSVCLSVCIYVKKREIARAMRNLDLFPPFFSSKGISLSSGFVLFSAWDTDRIDR